MILLLVPELKLKKFMETHAIYVVVGWQMVSLKGTNAHVIHF
jgi:hypothetical protein